MDTLPHTTAGLAAARRRWLARSAALAGSLALAAAGSRAGGAAGAAPATPAAAGASGPPGVRGTSGPPRGVAIALGSGSRHGMVHVGVIRALQARGFRPDLVTGTSAGAVAGALWALGLDAARIDGR